jgi:hypothetical protein
MALYAAAYIFDRGGYAEQLSPLSALAVGFALAFSAGMVVGATGFYLGHRWTEHRRVSASRTQHAG